MREVEEREKDRRRDWRDKGSGTEPKRGEGD